MKTYMGLPVVPGYEPILTVTENGDLRPLVGAWGWGKGNLKGADTTMAILKDYLGDGDLALHYCRRVYWRTLAAYPGEAPFRISGAEIDAVLADIRDGEPLLNKARTAASQEAPPIEREGGIGPGGTAFSEITKR